MSWVANGFKTFGYAPVLWNAENAPKLEGGEVNAGDIDRCRVLETVLARVGTLCAPGTMS